MSSDPQMPPPGGEPPPPERREGPRQLKRSVNDQVIGGVAGGLGHYFEIDPVLVRIAFVLLLFAGGTGILLYFVLWIIIPEASEDEDVVAPAGQSQVPGGLILGGAMVAIGAFILLREVVPGFDGPAMWAVLLMALGAFILLRGIRR